MRNSILPDSRLRRYLPTVLILIVWALLYLPHLRTSPGWYGDETLTLMIGRSLFQGQGLDRALHTTFWHPSYAYQPGYAWLVGAFAEFAGGDIIGGRFLNTLLALAIALTIAFLGKKSLGSTPSLFGALIFLTYSQSVIHFRWIYPHNAVALGFCLVVLLLVRKSRPVVNIAIGAGLSLATMSHPLFAHGAFAAWLCRIKRPAAWLPMALPPLLVLMLGLGWTLYRQWPHFWVFGDIRTLGEFYGTFSSENGQGWQAIRNVAVFYSHDFFHIGALLGACLCLRKRLYPVAVFLVVVSGLLLQNRQNLTVFYYQAVVFLPVLAVAWSGGIKTLTLYCRLRVGAQPMIRRSVIALYAIPLLFFVQIFPSAWSGQLSPRNHPWVTQDTNEVDAAARWLRANTSPQDLVICHQNIGWLLDTRTTDLMQATAWSGRSTFTFEKPLARERFAFPADLEKARFVVLGDIDQRWTLGQPNVSWIVEKLANDKWPIVWQGRYYVIVANPHAHY